MKLLYIFLNAAVKNLNMKQAIQNVFSFLKTIKDGLMEEL